MNSIGNAHRYSEVRHGSFAARLTGYMRRKMFREFMHGAAPGRDDMVLDIGATADADFDDSNYFERYYPYKDRMTVVSIQDAAFLTAQYAGLRFVRGDGRHLPFRDASFDYVHSAAVIEHVGDRGKQAQFVTEMIRVCRKGVIFTTPNRWFPVELHTALPVLHWLPPVAYRGILRRFGKSFYAEEKNLNLLDETALRAMLAAVPGISFRFVRMRLGGLCSNLVVVATKKS